MFLIPHSLRWNPTSTLLTAAFHPPIRPHPFKEHCYSLQSHKTPSSSDVLPSNPKTALQAYTLLPHTYTHIHTTTTSTHLPTHPPSRPHLTGPTCPMVWLWHPLGNASIYLDHEYWMNQFNIYPGPCAIGYHSSHTCQVRVLCHWAC